MVLFSKVQCSNEPVVALNEGIDTCLNTIVSKFSAVYGNFFFPFLFFLFSFPVCVPTPVVELLPEGCIKSSITQLSLLSLPVSEWFKHSTNVTSLLTWQCQWFFVCLFKIKVYNPMIWIISHTPHVPVHFCWMFFLILEIGVYLLWRRIF